jgi:hypothetical protein
MIKLIQPTGWQVFIDQDFGLDKFEQVCNNNPSLAAYVKHDDVVEGKLGVRYTFLTAMTQRQIERWLKEFLKN